MIKRKVLMTLLILLIGILALNSQVDKEAMRIHEGSIERAVSAFAIAKGLNAVISLIQGTEINAAPAGIGLTLGVGEVLDPLNDLVERFSWVMLAASVSLGIQKMLLSFGALAFVQFLLLGVLALFFAALWYRPLQRALTFSLLLRLASVLLILRFGALLFVHTESLLYATLMQQDYAVATQTLSETQLQLENIATQNDERIAQDESLFDSLSNSYEQAKELLDIKMQLASLQRLFDRAQKEVISLVTIFVVLTILLPLLFIWVFLSAFKWALTGRIDAESVQRWLTINRS
jgi:hypothetical protein